MEEIMLDLMYDLPEQAVEGARYLIDTVAVEQGKSLAELRMPAKESA